MGESGVKRQQWGLQQRLLSDDLNDISNLSARALIESIWAMSFGDAYRAVAAGVGGVVGGYTVQAQTGTLNVLVSPGLALIPHTQDDPSTDSPMVWIQSDAAETIDLSGLVDPTFPRLVTIEISADLGYAFEVENRDKIDPITGVYGIASFDVVVGGRPTYHANAGVASSAPVVAAGTPGRIPLAVVKLSAGLGFFADAFVSVLWCRPLVAALGDRLVPPRYVQGGGLSVGTSNGGGAFANTLVVDVWDVRAELDGLPARVRGQAEFNGTNVRTPDTTDPATLVGTAQPVFAYAVPAPWASDYGQVAPREAKVRNPNGLNIFSTPESVVLGDGSTFVSLAMNNPEMDNAVGAESCIVIFDTVAPVGLSYGPAGTAPVRVDDIRGPHPDTLGGSTIVLDATQDPTWGATQEVGDSVYLGCVSSLGIIPNQFMSQAYHGSGHVRVIDEGQPPPGTTYRPWREYTADSGLLAAIYPGRYPGMLVSDAEVLPDFATTVYLGSSLQSAGAGQIRMQLASEYGYGGRAPSPAVTAIGYTVTYNGGDLPNSQFGTEATPIERNAANRASIYFLGGVGVGIGEVFLSGYRDPILAAR